MRHLEIHEVFDAFTAAKGNKAKQAVLRDNISYALLDVIRGSMDKTIVWMVPEGAPPYTPCIPESVPSGLLKQNKNFIYFVKGGKGMSFAQSKREQIFIGLLEGIHPLDAEIVIAMIGKKKLVKGLTRAMVNEVFPALLKDNT